MTDINNGAEAPKKSPNAIYYNNKIKTNPEFYEKENKRVSEYIHNRYFNDPDYREKKFKAKKGILSKKEGFKKCFKYR